MAKKTSQAPVAIEAAEPEARDAAAAAGLADLDDMAPAPVAPAAPVEPAMPYEEEDARADAEAVAAALYRVPVLFFPPSNPDEAFTNADASAKRAGRRLGTRLARMLPNWLPVLAAVADGITVTLDRIVRHKHEEARKQEMAKLSREQG